MSAGAAPAAAEVSSAQYPADKAKSFVMDYIERHGLPGASYVVVKDGKPVVQGAAGDVSVDTPLSVGSVSKTFTAFAVLQLVDRGQVQLNAPITRYLEGFSIRGSDADDITIRMLLSHTSGLPNPAILPATGNLSEDVADIANLEAASKPGASYGYSNLNFRALARMIEVVSNEKFDAYLDAHIFEPLGMADTRSVISASSIEGLNNGHVTAYGAAIPLPELAADIGGAGGVISTAHDMGLWLQMQQRNGTTTAGTRLLSKRLITESHTVQPNAKTYGLGWQHTSTAEPARIGHDGSLTRYSSRVDLVPSSGYGVAVLLDSYTPTLQHPFSLSTGLIEISEGRTPVVGAPVSTIIDLGLGAISLLIAFLGMRGVRHSRRWAQRRSTIPAWRFVLRQVPQLIMPAIAGFLFLGLTLGSQNPATPLDAFGLWPAATSLILISAIVGITLIPTRSIRWFQERSARRARGEIIGPHAGRI